MAETDFGTNTADEYFDDLFRLTQFRTDPELSRDTSAPKLRDHGLVKK
jgi:hypothetical protein